MFQSNKQLSIQYIDTSNIESGALFDSQDVEAFYKLRAVKKKNFKMFLFRDWELFIACIMMKQAKEFNLN